MSGVPYRYYSQNGEDYLLWQFFDHKPTGFYVEVGAFDGVHLSNTYSFEQQGWRGICIEPHPVYVRYCEQARPNSICIHAACVGDDQRHSVEFFSEPVGLLSGLTGDGERVKDVRSRYEARQLAFENFERVTVPAMTLTAILDRYLPAGTPIDFMSIDVEGAELEVLRGLDLRRFRPRVLLLEEGDPRQDRDKARALRRLLIDQNGYHFARHIAQNRYYVTNRRDAAKLRRIEINCDMELTLHPLGEQYTAHKLRRPRHVYHPPERDTLPQRLLGILARRQR